MPFGGLRRAGVLSPVLLRTSPVEHRLPRVSGLEKAALAGSSRDHCWPRGRQMLSGALGTQTQAGVGGAGGQRASPADVTK